MNDQETRQGKASMAREIVPRMLCFTTLALALTWGVGGANKARALDVFRPGDIATEARPSLDHATMARVTQRAGELGQLHSLIVARHGTIRFERSFRGPGLDVPVNVKSVAKVIVSALVGIAIDRGLFDGPD
ncbi:MAG: hypothetical protein AB7P12_13635, partial [Alphaproteobacteria bacterium]